MTVYCKLCGHKITSDSPDAQKSVLEKMGIHIGVHQKESAELAQTLMTGSHLLATYLLIKNFVTIPENETALLDSFAENERSLRQLFQLEPEPTGAN